MSVENKVELVSRPPTEEIVTKEDLVKLFDSTPHPNHYIGYEISGKLHLGSIVLPGMKIRDFVEAGCNCVIYLADWHSWVNNKLGGDLDKIQKAVEYYREAFSLVSPKAKILVGSDLYHENDDYWKNFVRVSKSATLKRITRCLTVMGRKEGDSLDFAQYLYPSMQAADIREMGIQIAHAGMDQRKLHMLTRDVFPKLGWEPPVAVHHHLLPGLLKPEREGYDENAALDMQISSKMSKSKPWTCIFIHDSKDEIRGKLAKAWCPEKSAENNGVLEIVKYIIFRESDRFSVERPPKFGGDVSFDSYAAVEEEYKKGALHPADLKNAVAEYVDRLIEPYRKHFEKSSKSGLLDIYNE